MTSLNEDFEYCLKKFGRPAGGEPLDPTIIEAYRSKVPEAMGQFWTECGVGLWLEGRFQLVRPDRYQGLIDMILDGDQDFQPNDSVLIGYSSFGELFIWNNKNYLLTVDLVEKHAYTTHPGPDYNILPPDITLPIELSRVDDIVYDFYEHTDDAKPLFSRAMKKCGKLAYGECYGFLPAVGLGGRGVLEDTKKFRALEHFSLIAQLAPIELRFMDTKNRKIVVLRELGG